MNINQPAENVVLPFMKPRKINLDNHDQVRRHRQLVFAHRLPNRVRVELVAGIGEFVGTFMFLFFAFSATQVANFVAPGASAVSDGPNTSNLLYISLAFGFSLAVNAWVFFRITGGLFNPAVTLGMCLIGAVTWMRGLVVFVAQILGGIAAAAVVSALFPGPLGVRTSLSTGANGTPQTSVVRGLFIEMFLTAELVFTIFMLAAEKHKATFIAPIGIGLALFIAELSGVYFTGGSLNPARSFGPAVVAGEFYGYHWIYWVGPALGSIVAVVFYKLVKALEYETVVPGQDLEAKEAANFEDDELPRTRSPNTNGMTMSPVLPSGGAGGRYDGTAVEMATSGGLSSLPATQPQTQHQPQTHTQTQPQMQTNTLHSTPQHHQQQMFHAHQPVTGRVGTEEV